ncbi:general secretion pathway protein GspK [Lichenicoccus sp.]|uniref:general secretion pathway protein GspK n=1 Tax=Lichenicoccus sp. TaxID=2781899 RepID=UPI003D0F91AE
MADKTRDRGFALLIVLWTLSLLSLLISQLAGSGRQALRLAGNMRMHAALQAAADGAVQEAGFHVAAAGVAHWAADGVAHGLSEDGARIGAQVTNEAGRVNPSIASLDLLAATVHQCGPDTPQSIAVASAIVAWRFPSAQTSYGADAYVRAHRAYAPPGQPFESLDELSLVLGMTPALLGCLTPHLSLYATSDPDPDAADPFVLRALTQVIGAPPPQSNAPVEESLVRIGVVATGPDGARASRQAILRMITPNEAAPGTGGSGDGGSLAPYKILSWTP